MQREKETRPHGARISGMKGDFDVVVSALLPDEFILALKDPMLWVKASSLIAAMYALLFAVAHIIKAVNGL